MLTLERSKPKTKCTFYKKKKQFRMITSLVSAAKNTVTLMWPCSKSIWEFTTGRTVKYQSNGF